MLEYTETESKSYEERYQEALTQIPLYTKDWTNFNAADPGITILENMIGFETLQQERLLQIPFRVRQNLMKLVGFEIRKGRPARLLLCAEGVKAPVMLPQNHKFRLGPLTFETNRRIAVDDSRVTAAYSRRETEDRKTHEKKVIIRDCATLLDHETAVPVEIFGEQPQAQDALYLILNRLPESRREVIFYFSLRERGGRNPLPEHVENTFAAISWELYTDQGFVPLKVRDCTNAFLTSGEVRLRLPEERAALWQDKDAAGIPEGYCIRAVLTRADYDVRPRVTAIWGFLFEVWQKDTLSEVHTFHKAQEVELESEISREAYIDVFVREEKGGSYRRYEITEGGEKQGRYYERKDLGNGRHSIRFDRSRYGFAPLSGRGCVEVLVYTEDVARRYALGKVLGYDDQVIELPYKHLVNESFCILAKRTAANGEAIYDFVRPDRYEDEALTYHLLENDGTIVIEDAGAFIGAQLFLAACSTMRGSEGNIRAGNTLVSDHDRSGIRYYAPGAGMGGAYRERLESVRQRFLKDIETPYTAVTEADYQRIVQRTPGLCIHKVGASMDAERNLIQIAVKPATDERFPKLSPIYEKTILKELERRRLLSTRVEILQPMYASVNVTARIYVKPHYENARAQIEALIREKTDYLRSDKGFGELLKFDDIFHAVEMLPCVEFVYELSLRPQTATFVRMQDADILPDKNCLLYPGEIVIEEIAYEQR